MIVLHKRIWATDEISCKPVKVRTEYGLMVLTNGVNLKVVNTIHNSPSNRIIFDVIKKQFTVLSVLTKMSRKQLSFS